MAEAHTETPPRNQVGTTPIPLAAIIMRPFEPRDTDTFRDLNEAWITSLFGMEEEDRRILNDPIQHVLEPGGHIFIAESDGHPIACCALVLMRPGVFELAKMAVSEVVRGQGVGRLVLQHVIAFARQIHAHELELCTNHRLANAIHLYESLGFQHLPPERVAASPFARANVFMELHL